MKQIILILEGKSSTEIDYKYIKSVMDYYYDTRKYSVKRINANGKSKLMDQEKRIKELVKRYNGDSIVVIVSDFDREDDILNNRISDYSKRNLYDLVWMNRNIEDVFLGKVVSSKEKEKQVLLFLKNKNKIIADLNNLNVENPVKSKQSSNLLLVLDKYLERKMDKLELYCIKTTI